MTKYKETRSLSLPARQGVTLGEGERTRVKERSARSRENKYEDDFNMEETNFSMASLCFKTDMITVGERLELTERQRNIASEVIAKEINNFSSLTQQLLHICNNPELREILKRLGDQASYIKEATKQLSVVSESLGAVRQELRVANMVSVMVEYVEVLREKCCKVHNQLSEARQMIDKNNIVIVKDKPVTEKASIKVRSVSLVSPSGIGMTMVTRRASTGHQSDTQDLSPEGGTCGVRQQNKKCSVFETIEEHCDLQKDPELSPLPSSESCNITRKTSKKVSIAENLNCDYSDDNLTDLEESWEDSHEKENYVEGFVTEDESCTNRFQEGWTSFINYLFQMIIPILFLFVFNIPNHPRIFVIVASSLIVTSFIMSV